MFYPLQDGHMQELSGAIEIGDENKPAQELDRVNYASSGRFVGLLSGCMHVGSQLLCPY